MRKYIIFCLVLGGLLTACNRDEILMFKGSNHIQFVKEVKDSTMLSFFAHPGVNEYRLPVEVILTGYAYEEEVAYSVVVNEEFTTAEEGKHFRLPEKMTIGANRFRDTCWITLYRHEELQTEEKRLVIGLKDKDPLKVGQAECSVAVIRMNDKITKPGWWDIYIQFYYLGSYTATKYRKFIEATGVLDPGPSDSERRFYALQFKYWLQDKKAAGETVYDENGKEMTVVV